MTSIGKAIGSFFDDDVTYKDNSVAIEQEKVDKQEKAQISQQKNALERQRLAMLRGRFSGSGGQPSVQSQDSDQAAANLFSRITGRNQ